ncbi:ArsR/SmtB family transcription factor [Halovenus marina]|uniref:ArsR/SmtB family transcription factor n=1 Tax=Halovenus marina TaxID=3396621 RepID=UPI003F546A47
MSSLFPLRGSVEHEQREPRLVELDEDTADEVFETLAARTTREVFLELHREPKTASDIAEATETSVQNAQYHLEKLSDADLIEVVDTWYSERGTEMNVYAPTDESLVLFAGEDTERSLGSVLKRLAGALGLLVPASVLVGLVTSQTISGGESVGRGDDGVGTATIEDVDGASHAVDTLFGLDPAIAAGLLFLLGGLFVAVVALAVQYRGASAV